MGLGVLSELQLRSGAANGRPHTIAFCPLYHPQMKHLIWRISMMKLWTGFTQQQSVSDDTIGPNEEEET